jgi:hypothetical protein
MSSHDSMPSVCRFMAPLRPFGPLRILLRLDLRHLRSACVSIMDKLALKDDVSRSKRPSPLSDLSAAIGDFASDA